MPYPNPADPVSAMTRADGNTEEHSTDHGRVIGIWENVKHWGAAGDGVTDDSDAFTNAAEAAGLGGTVYVPDGTFLLSDWTPPFQLHIRGAGAVSPEHQGLSDGGGAPGGTVLKAKAGATWVIRLVADTETLYFPSISNLMIHGNHTAGCVTVNTGGETYGVQGVRFDNVEFYRGNPGVVLDTAIINQNDATLFTNCRWDECDGFCLWINSYNAQETTLINGKMSGSAVGVKISGGTLTWIGGQIGTIDTCFLFDNSNVFMLTLIDFISEGDTIGIDGTDYWPVQGVHLIHTLFASSTHCVIIGGSSSVLRADLCQWNTGDILASGNDTVFIDNNNVFYLGGGTWTSTGANNRRIKTDINGTYYYFDDTSTPKVSIYVTGEVQTAGVSTLVKAGVPDDTDFYFETSGMMAVDSSNNRLYVRVGTTWKYTALT